MKMFVLLFEGSEKVGKTTLARKLSKFIGVSYFKSCPPSTQEVTGNYEDIAFNNIKLIYDLLKTTQTPLIIDRLLASQFVYGTVMRGKTDVRKIKMYDKLFARQLNAVIVYCECNLKNNERRFKKEKIIAFDKVDKLKEKFHEYLKFTKCKKIIVNTDKEIDESFLDLIEELSKLGVVKCHAAK